MRAEGRDDPKLKKDPTRAAAEHLQMQDSGPAQGNWEEKYSQLKTKAAAVAIRRGRKSRGYKEV